MADILIAWGTLNRRNAIAWDRLNRLLLHYGIQDPATGQPYMAAGAAVPPQPLGPAGIAEFQRRLTAFKTHISL